MCNPLKTHNLNCNIDNYSFSDKNNTLATIYIVRDPRNLVNSISNHFGKSIKESKNFKNKLDLSRELNVVLERMVTRNPNQWIWTHNRWKI